MQQNLISNIVRKTADFGAQIQLSDGSMPPGRNGPHQHKMTPVRNTGHWAVLFSNRYKMTKKKKWEDVLRKSINYIISEKFHPLNGAFLERLEPHCTSTNGLIGQTWTLESINIAGTVLNDSKYSEIAKHVVRLHEFDSDLALWREIDIVGIPQNFCNTLNQQIWFMNQALEILPGSKMKKQADAFLNQLPNVSKIRRTGLFYTGISIPTRRKLDGIRRLRRDIIKNFQPDDRLEIDIGYHVFTLTGLAMLYEKLPNHSYFQCHDFNKALEFAFSEEYFRSLEKNKYGYPYNVPGFELPFVWETFRKFLPEESIDVAIKCFVKQCTRYYSFKDPINALHSQDPETLMARFYEITRIKNGFLKIMEKDTDDKCSLFRDGS